MGNLESAVREHLIAGRLPCAKAFAIAGERSIPPRTVCEAADGIDIRLSRCQLGLFGYEDFGEKRPASALPEVPAPLKVQIEQRLVDGKLPCAAAWQLAEDAGLPRFALGCICETLGIRVAPCQLGCF